MESWAASPDGPRIGVLVLPEHDWATTRRLWTGLEAMGVHHGWTYDHHSWRTLRDSAWYDAVGTLTAVAATTHRMGIGTLVSSPNHRHPAVLAKQVMTADQVSGGRFVLGIGAGAPGGDARLLGGPELSPRRRFDRLAEFVELSDLLLRQRATTYRGEFFEAVDARMVPGCVQRPRVPFAIAGSGPRTLELTARYADCWVTIGDARGPGEQPEEEGWRTLARQASRLDGACAKAGRDPAAVGRLVNVSRVVEDPCASEERFREVVGRCRDLGFTDVVVARPRPAGVFAGDPEVFEKAVRAVLDRR